MPLACEANAPTTQHHPALTIRLIHMPKACPYKLLLLISDFIKAPVLWPMQILFIYV